MANKSKNFLKLKLIAKASMKMFQKSLNSILELRSDSLNYGKFSPLPRFSYLGSI